MQLRKNGHVGLVVGLLFSYQAADAQSQLDSRRAPLKPVDAVSRSADQSIKARVHLDSVRRVLDSLEVSLLRTTQTYGHVERLLASFSSESTSLDLVPAVLPVDLPIEDFRISSPFGIRQHPIHKRLRFHAGVDVKAPRGMVVKATAPGLVSQVGFDQALGAFVRVQHAFGFETTFGHLDKYCVQPGQLIARNEEIGRVGQTGLATGAHLHYTIKKNGSTIDPFQFCFLLRRRLWLHKASKEAASGNSVSDPGSSLSSKGSYPN